MFETVSWAIFAGIISWGGTLGILAMAWCGVFALGVQMSLITASEETMKRVVNGWFIFLVIGFTLAISVLVTGFKMDIFLSIDEMREGKIERQGW